MLLVVHSIYTVLFSVTLYKWKVYLIMPNQLALFAVRQFDYFISKIKIQSKRWNIDEQNIVFICNYVYLSKCEDQGLVSIKCLVSYDIKNEYIYKNYIYFKISI